MRSLLSPVVAGVVLLSSAGAPATADIVLSQPMVSGGGVMRTSSLWVDPTGQNDSDTDSIAWASFTLPVAGTVSEVRWWGEAPPSLGFDISFHNQDPNTTASQPDIFRPESHPIGHQTFPTVSSSPAGTRYMMSVQLATPLHFEAGIRYFVSVVGLTPNPWPNWSWAQSLTGTGTFWWVRGNHMYYGLGDSRAFEFLGTLDETGPCNPADLADPRGVLDLADISAFVTAFVGGQMDADLDSNGVLDLADISLFITAFTAGCP